MAPDFTLPEEEEEEEEEKDHFLFLSSSVIARCFVSFILVQFSFTSVFMLQFCLFKEEEEEIEEEEEEEEEGEE